MNEESKPLALFDCVGLAEAKFREIAESTGLIWDKEEFFAFDQLSKNSYSMNVARQNPNSVKMAMVNVASIGLSLNPATKYAYLVPRKIEKGGAVAICLDISYQGLIKIATDSGSIKWAKAELIYEGDDFLYKGPAQMPEIGLDPFQGERGKPEGLKGVICIAKTADDDFLIEAMTAEEVFKIRDEASSMKSEKGRHQSPWTRYFGEMAKKAVIKRAQKTWPKTERHERLQHAVEFINESEGSDWGDTHRFKPGEKVQIIEQMREALTKGDDFGVIELVQEHTTSDPEESMKFWALFSPTERSCINSFMDESKVERERLIMKRPDLNEEITTPGL